MKSFNHHPHTYLSKQPRMRSQIHFQKHRRIKKRIFIRSKEHKAMWLIYDISLFFPTVVRGGSLHSIFTLHPLLYHSIFPPPVQHPTLPAPGLEIATPNELCLHSRQMNRFEAGESQIIFSNENFLIYFPIKTTVFAAYCKRMDENISFLRAEI